MRIAVINDTSVTRHFGCTAVMQVLLDEIKNYGHEVAFRWPVGVDWKTAADCGFFDGVDLIIVNGEGTIHNSASRPRASHLGRLGPFASRELGIPACLINSTLASLDKATLSDLQHFRSIFVRETASQRYLNEYGLRSEVVPDLSLGKLAQTGRERESIIVTDSVVESVSETLRKTADQISGKFLPFKRKRTLLEKLTLRGRTDSLIVGDIIRDRLVQDLDSTLRDFSAARTLLTGRFHAFCMAILSRTPVIAVESNTHKIGSMAVDIFGSADRVLSSGALTVEALASRVPSSAFSEQELEGIESYLCWAEKARRRMWEGIL